MVDLPDSGGVVLTGRLSVSSHPWLADHAVGGVVLFPGAGFVELAIRAADEVGCGQVEELMLHAPLVLPPGGVAVQVVVGPAFESGAASGQESGTRAVSVFSRAGTDGSEWVLHADGLLTEQSVEPEVELSVWPPPGATEIEVTDAYSDIAARGYQYGPAFQGLKTIWRRGEEIFAEVAIPEDLQSTGFGVHPVLLDSALHAVLVAADHEELALPFSWQKVSLHASGASAVRVRIAPSGPNAVSIELADGLGLPVLSVQSMVARPVTSQQLAAAMGGGRVGELFEVDLVSVPEDTEKPTDGEAVWYESLPHSAQSVPDAVEVHAATHRALERVKSWLAESSTAVLLVVTRGAVALPGEDVTDLAGAAVWGLVRAAQTENPGRIVLVDTDSADLPDASAVLAAAEPQIVVARRCAAPRARAAEPGGDSHSRATAGRAVAVGGRDGRHLRQSGTAGDLRSGCTAGTRACAGRGARRRGELPRRDDHPRRLSR